MQLYHQQSESMGGVKEMVAIAYSIWHRGAHIIHQTNSEQIYMRMQL